jgi:hypothetical protein
MKISVQQRLLAAQEAAIKDDDYRQLALEHEEMNRTLLILLESLPEEQKETVLDYLGLCAQMHMRMLEILCEI